MSDRIDEMKARVELAEATEADLRKLVSETIGAYTIIDDGEDRWIAETDEVEECIEELMGEILDGSVEPDPEEGYQPAYDRLCTHCECLYTRIGSASNIDSLVNDLECDDSEKLRIFRSLGIQDEDLPAMIHEDD